MPPPIDPARLPVATPLEVARENLEFDLPRVVAELERHRRVEVRARATQIVCTMHRRLGIVAVLTLDQNRVLLDRLARSGMAYLDLLGRVDWKDLVDGYDLCSARAYPFLDALAAGDLVRVRAINLLSAPSRFPDDEDEEDQAYMRLVMALAASDAPPDAALLEAYRAAADEDAEDHAYMRLLMALAASEGPPDPALLDAYRAAADEDAPRRKVLDAILAGDREAYDDALRVLAARRREEMDEERKNPSADPVFLLTEAHVFVEGIALARLGALRGLTPIGRVPLIPQPAWKLDPAAFPADGAWRSAE